MDLGYQGDRIVVGVCREQSCQEALTWAIANKITHENDTLILLHVVSKVPNPKTEMFQSEVSDANFLHFARTVVQPFMMALKAKVDPKIRLELKVGRNNSKSKGILDEVRKLRATVLVLGSSARGMFSVRKFSSLVTYCIKRRPSAIELCVVQKEKLAYASSKAELSNVSISRSSSSSSKKSDLSSLRGGGSVADNMSYTGSLDDDECSVDDTASEASAPPHLGGGHLRSATPSNLSGRRNSTGKDSPAPIAPIRALAEGGLPMAIGGMTIAGRRALPTHYRIYTYEEIQAATDNFDRSKLLGEGGFGTVYHANLHHTQTAVKVLKTADTDRALQEFQQEVEMLGQIQHPHVVMLLGCCPERHCLVYELMSQGSLEDRLRCKSNSPPLPWFVRVRVMAEIASALLCLHTRPVPIVHRDLKPGNVLLDKNLVSKLADVGLATLVLPPQNLDAGEEATGKEQGAVGTLAYVDPEFRKTGEFGPKSDVYALGIVLLDLLTSLKQQSYVQVEEAAMNKDRAALVKLLDPKAGDWPADVAMEIAELAMWCSEATRKQRPDLETEVMPVLDRLRAQAIESEEEAKRAPVNGEASNAPSYLYCPITQEIMVNPVLASDGHTYELIAIQRWMEKSDRSPMTNMKLPNRALTPNLEVRQNIQEWLSKQANGAR